ncbi:MAG: hypothetical protein M3R38_20740 [Actinomycetota bacterium]|nr:hypothetical protein [Actinomycetota bacterium]
MFITFSTAHTAAMQITNATAAATRPFMSMERRCRGGRFENQSRAARIRPTKLSFRSGRPAMIVAPPGPPAGLCAPQERILVGTARTRLEALSI